MANVKITELTELAAVDVADNDVVPIVDVGGDTTKKVTAASLRTALAEANDYVTYTLLNANLDIVSGNADSYYTQLNSNIDVVSSNADAYNVQLNANIDVVWSNVGTSYATLVLLNSVQDNVASAESNVAALRVEYLANVASTEANVLAVESRRADNTFFTYNTDSNVIITDANVEPSSNNTYSLGAPDLVWKDIYLGPGTLYIGNVTIAPNETGSGITITGADASTTTVDTATSNVTASLNLLQDNVTAAESNVTALDTRVNANVDVVQDNLTVYSGSSNAGIRVAVEQFGNLALQSNTVDFALLESFAPEHAEGRVHYHTGRNALEVMGPGISANVIVGQDEMVYVKNTSGASIDQLKPVYLVSEDGGTPTIALANAATETTAYAVGLTAESIADEGFGFVQRAGIAFGDTTGLTAGQRVHVSPSAGGLQNASPTYPYFSVDLGIVLITDGTNGCIYLDVQNQTTESFRVTGSAYVDADLTIGGNLAVLGSESITSVNSLAVGNTLIYLNSGDTIGDAATLFIGSGLDDGTLVGHYEGPITETFNVMINATGTPDTFDWSLDNFATYEAVSVAITGSPQALANGISINFGATTGHTTGDQWSGTAAPLNLDTGWVSNRNTGLSEPGYTHVGMFFDITDSKFKIFDEYDPEPSGIIDTGDASFSLGDLSLSTLQSTVATGTAPFTVASTTLVTNLNADLLDGVQGSVYERKANTSATFIQLNANLDVTNDNVVTLTTTVDNFGTSSNANAAALASDIATLSTVDTATGTETRLNANLDVTNDNVSTLTTTVDNFGTYANTTFSTVSNAQALASAIATAPGDIEGVTAGAGLTGGGTTGTVTLNIGAGTGVTVNADDIAIGQAVGTGDSPTFAGLTVTTFDLGAL
jgi:hypothetical protein